MIQIESMGPFNVKTAEHNQARLEFVVTDITRLQELIDRLDHRSRQLQT